MRQSPKNIIGKHTRLRRNAKKLAIAALVLLLLRLVIAAIGIPTADRLGNNIRASTSLLCSVGSAHWPPIKNISTEIDMKRQNGSALSLK